jgi:hypothetical protein
MSNDPEKSKDEKKSEDEKKSQDEKKSNDIHLTINKPIFSKPTLSSP